MSSDFQSRGGLARAARLSADRRSEIATAAARARWGHERPLQDVSVDVLLKLRPETVAMIDERRGDLSRAKWVANFIAIHFALGVPQMTDEEVSRVMRGISAPEAG